MSRPAKWSLVCVLGMGLLFGLTVVLLHFQATRAIQRHESTVRARLAELRAQGLPRTSNFGSALPDRGWDLYLQAKDGLAGMEDTRFLQGTFVSSVDVLQEGDKDKISALWDSCNPILTLVRRAVRCPNQDRDPGIEETQEYTEFKILCNLLLTGAVHFHRSGRDRDAFDTLLLFIAVSHDTTGRLYEGCGWSPNSDEVAAEVGIQFLEDYTLTAKDLEELAAGLDQLEEQRPSVVRQYRTEDALEREKALEGELRTWQRTLPLEAGWRSLFLPSVARAAALREIEAAYRAYEDVDRLPVDQRFQAAEGLGPPWRNGEAPGTCLTPTNNRYFEEILVLASWAHLRLALAIARYQVDHGHSPAQLEDLVPRYLQQIPRRLYMPEFPPRSHSDGNWPYVPNTSTLKDREVKRRPKS